VSVEEAVREHLLAAAGVSALVGTRVYMLRLPQHETLPSVRVQLVDEPKNYHLRGPSGATRARVQVDAYAEAAGGADPYATATAVADAVDAALSGQVFNAGSPVSLRITGAMRDGRRPFDEPDELRQVRVSQDYIVWSRPVG
jgi:hypothetical protein